MNKNNNTLMGRLVSRLCATVVLFVVGSMAAMAQDDFGVNKLSINQMAGLTFIPGVEKDIVIELDNETPISSVQFDIALPDGLTLKKYEKDLSRMTKNGFTLMFEPRPDEYQNVYEHTKYRAALLTNATDMTKAALKGNHGAIMVITVVAETGFHEGTIIIDGGYGSTEIVENGKWVESKSVELTCDEKSYKASLHVGTATLNHTGDLSMWTDGDVHEVTLNLENDVELTGLQADIVMPLGVTILTDEDGEYVFEGSDRLSEHVSIMASKLAGVTTANQYRVVVSSITADKFVGTNGPLFSFKVKASTDFAEAGEVKVFNVKAAGVSGRESYVIDGAPAFKVNPVSDITGDGKWNVDDLQQWIDDAFIGKNTDRRYDVTRDGKIEVDDLDAVVERIMKSVQAGEGE